MVTTTTGITCSLKENKKTETITKEMQKKYIESNSESFFINIIITIVVNNNTQFIAEFKQLINVTTD